MAIDFTDLKVESYRRSPQPFPLVAPVNDKTPDQKIEDFRKYMEEELRRIEKSIESLVTASPQVAINPPDPPLKGMIRYAKAPWNPLGTGDGWVYYNGTTWIAVSPPTTGYTWATI